MELQLAGKRAIVSGGSAGIGRAIAAELAREGVSLAISARTAGPLLETAQELSGETGSQVVPIVADMSRLPEIQRFVREAASALGGIDIVVNNAGSAPAAPFLEMPDEDWESALQLKFLGYVRTSREAVPHLQRAGGGVIVNIIGTGGKAYFLPHYVAGGASNSAIMLLTVGLATELAPDNIRVVGINPGLVSTARMDRLLTMISRVKGREPEAIRQEFLDATPSGAITSAADVANLAVFLASSKASQINGTIVTIDGGLVKTI